MLEFIPMWNLEIKDFLPHFYICTRQHLGSRDGLNSWVTDLQWAVFFSVVIFFGGGFW